jgi:hypothetical protein
MKVVGVDGLSINDSGRCYRGGRVKVTLWHCASGGRKAWIPACAEMKIYAAMSLNTSSQRKLGSMGLSSRPLPHTLHISHPIRRCAISLRRPQHLSQAFHDGVMCFMLT